MSWFLQLDHQLFQFINSLAGRWQFLDWLGIFCAKYLIYVIFIIVIAWWLDLHRTKPSTHWPLEGRKKWLVFGHLSLSVGLALLANQLLALIRFRVRPFMDMQINKLINKPFSEKSFPSDHTSFAFAMAVVVFCYNKKLGIVLLILSLLVGLSRIYVGVHYPLDILGGIVVGSLAAIVFYFIFRKKTTIN